MSKEEIRGVTGGKVMQCLLCNQEDLVVCSVLYETPMEGCQNGGGVGPTVVKKTVRLHSEPIGSNLEQLD